MTDRDLKPLNTDLALLSTLGPGELRRAVGEALEQVVALRNQVAELKAEAEERRVTLREMTKPALIEQRDGDQVWWFGPAARKRMFELVEAELRALACDQLLVFDTEVSGWRPHDAQGILCDSLLEVVETMRARSMGAP